MKSIGIVALLLLSLAQPSHANLINLKMHDFSYPIWNADRTQIIGSGTGGRLSLLIDERAADGSSSRNEGFFEDAIKGGSFWDEVNHINFFLDPRAYNSINTIKDGYISIGFGGTMKDENGRQGKFSLYLEGNFPSSACDSLADLELETATWIDSIYFQFKGDSVDFVGAVPRSLQVADVPEPAPLFTMLLGFVGILFARSKNKSANRF